LKSHRNDITATTDFPLVVHGEIEFKDVHFSYTKGSPVLQGLNLKIAAGESIGLVGKSGSGKTSLVNLLYRFYEIDSGVITIDGIDIRKVLRQSLRRHMSLVQQEPFLFRGTLGDNIAYGCLQADPSQILEASLAANCHEFVMAHPLAYETPVGESGMSLSEIGIVVDIDEFIPAQQQLIFATLAQKDNCHYIQRVRRIKRSTGYIEFRVGTASGDRNFVLRDAPDSVMDFGLKGRMLLDLEDNLYVIRDLSQLPPREKQLFENTIFW
jgi:ABC-type sugar transport system ATPase subunit